MSILDMLASIPCVDSRKRARDIIEELRAKGFEIVRRGPELKASAPSPLSRPILGPKAR